MGWSNENRILDRLKDVRGRRVVFVSHCILNENTRYQGGAFCRGAIVPLLDSLVKEGLGIIQMPCPEQAAWGGVAKRLLRPMYGLDLEHPRLGRAKGLLALAFIGYSRFRFRGVARGIMKLMKDYLNNGYSIGGVLGVDGSPTCGVFRTMVLKRALEFHAGLPMEGMPIDQYNCALFYSSVEPGRGLFVRELDRLMRRRGIVVPLRAHDLVRESEGGEPR